jgi:ATP-dependent helicase/nuclease subunit A
MKLTHQQQKVVDADVGNLLVSAAAGSGKTSVMTERIASRIIDGRLDVNHVLVMTFTNAAASNMRDKIERKLTDALAIETDSGKRNKIAEQIACLPMSHISTIHAFCLDVIHNFGYDARTPEGEVIVEPGFSTLDDMRRTLLLQESIDEVLSALYELSHQSETGSSADDADQVLRERSFYSDRITPFTLLDEDITRADWLRDFDRMSASFGNARSDAPLRDLIMRRHSYLRSLPFYETWVIEKLRNMREATQSFGTSHNAQTLMSDFFTALELAAPKLTVLKGLLPNVQFVKDKTSNQKYHDFYAEIFHIMGELLETYAKKELTWNRCVHYAHMLPDGKHPSVKSNDTESVRSEFFMHLTSVRESIYYLTGKGATQNITASFRTPARHLFARTEEELQEDLLYMLPVASRLYEVLLLIDDRYASKKRAENAVDFSDYEHLALLLLSRPDAKTYYSNIFSEIYIDEYQDNSRIQDAIVSCFSRKNCFVVGDVKQSIYRFRHARPQLFMDRLHAYQNHTDGELLELNSNFRSRPGILRVVNRIFTRILSEASGDIEYDDVQKLVPERDDDPARPLDPCVELILVDLSAQTEMESEEVESPEEESDMSRDENPDAEQEDIGDTNEEKLSFEDLGKIEKSALVIISKIRELSAKGAVEWGDIAILTRTNKEASVFRDQLILHGIPAEGVGESVFLSSRELLLMESLMKVLDNFRQDIPLAAVMRASFPQSGFTDSELLAIRLSSRAADDAPVFFHEAVLRIRDSGPDSPLRTKVQRFCDWIDALRSQSMYLRVSELIEKIYVETGIRERVSALPDGGKRMMDLETFRDWANKYENARNSGLYRFVTYMEDIREKGESPEDFDPEAKERDVVHCLSIHKSKGLEFKYVFVGGLDRGFPSGGSGSKTLLSENFGIGIDYIRPDEGYFYPTHSKLAMETDESRADLAENMRLLYVAMTRAEERLYLVGCISRKKDGSIGRSAVLLPFVMEETSPSLPAWLVRKSKSFLDFVILGLAGDPTIPFHVLAPDGETFMSDAGQTKSDHHTDVHFEVVSAMTLFAGVEIAPDLPLTTVAAAVESAPSVHVASVCQDLTDQDIRLFELQLRGEYPYKNMTRIPAKMSVSERKRRVNDYDRMEDEDDKGVPDLLTKTMGRRPVNLVVQPIIMSEEQGQRILSPAEIGTLLHSVFQYLDFTSLPVETTEDRVCEAVSELVRRRMIRHEQIGMIEPYYSSIAKFTSSSLCARMVAAEKDHGRGPFREIPFSITVPAGQTDVSLVQGMIDCWFIENGNAILVDYKSDRIAGHQEDKARILQERYAVQLDYYAKAIEAATRMRVTERVIWLIPDGLSFLLEAPGRNLL